MKSLERHIHNIYFLGIGGIGMSAIARYFHLKGKEVKGYDRVRSVVTERLEKEGMEIFYMMDKAHVQGKDLVVYTPAIPADSEEFVAAKALGIPMLKRSEVLGEISKEYKTLAVAGTHGKTTTSTMLAHILRYCGCDCTAFLGGISNNLNGNFVMGNSDYLVVEADEFDRSFLTLHPEKTIITSIDPDHLDIYGDAEEMNKSYREFADQSMQLWLANGLERNDWGKPVKTYGIEMGDFRAERLRFAEFSTLFDFRSDEWDANTMELHLPGHHNVLNMTAAIAVALQLPIERKLLPQAVAAFSGIYRRFQLKFHSDHLSYIDDYAHHPSEIEVAIKTARSLFPDRQLMVIFQPHLFSRTKDFCEGFATELSKADRVLLMDIYPAREVPIPGVSSLSILDKMILEKKEIVGKESLLQTIGQYLDTPTVLMTLGAGDIDKEVDEIEKTVKELALEI